MVHSDIEAIVDGLWSKGQAGGLSSDEFRVFYDLLKIHNERD